MKTYRKSAVIAGVLYIIGTIAGVLSLAFSGPIRVEQDVLASIAANAGQVRIAILCVLVMGLSLAMVPIVLYPILKRFNSVLAIGYVVFRGALETVGCFVTPVIWFLLLALGQLNAQAGDLTSSFQAQGALLVQAGELSSLAGIVFCLGAAMFYTVLYQSKLVPRWLAGWGLVAVIPYLAAESLALFAILGLMSGMASLLCVPMALQEMVLAVWLIVKGFSPAALASMSTTTATHEA
jgi:hypothetical protein